MANTEPTIKRLRQKREFTPAEIARFNEDYNAKKPGGNEDVYSFDAYKNKLTNEGYTDDDIADMIEASEWNKGNKAKEWLKSYSRPDTEDTSNQISAEEALFNQEYNTENKNKYLNALHDAGVSKADLRSNIPDNEQYKNAISGTDYANKNNKDKVVNGIMGAYYRGDIDKDTRDYLIVDTLAKFTRNLGRDMGNVAAAYSGGTMNNDREEGLWEQRNKGIMETRTDAEQNAIAGSNKNLAYQKGSLDVEKANKQLIPARVMQDLASNPNTPWWAKGAANAMTAKYAGADIDIADVVTTMIAQGGVELEKEAAAAKKPVKEYVTDYLKSVIPFSGGIQIGSMLSGQTPEEKREANQNKMKNAIDTAINDAGNTVAKYIKGSNTDRPGQAKKALDDIEKNIRKHSDKLGIPYERPAQLQEYYNQINARISEMNAR